MFQLKNSRILVFLVTVILKTVFEVEILDAMFTLLFCYVRQLKEVMAIQQILKYLAYFANLANVSSCTVKYIKIFY